MRTLALILLLAAPMAHAIDLPDGGGSGSSGCDVGCGVLLGLTFGLDLTVDVVDVVVLAGGGHLSPGWAIVQGLWGGGHVVVGGIVTGLGILGAVLNTQGSGGVLALGLVTLGEGILLLIIAITSAVAEVREQRELRRSRLAPRVGLSVDPRGGALASLAWSF